MTFVLAMVEHAHWWSHLQLHLFHIPVHELIQEYGYVAVFGLLFACGLGFPLPEDIPLIASGLCIARGQFHLAIIAPVAWLGIIGGDCVLYTLGYKLGWNVVHLPMIGRHVSEKRLKRVEGWFDRYGVWAVGIGRMFAGVRGAMVVAAGTLRFNFIKFIIADGLAAIVSGGLFLGLGYWAGKHGAKMWEARDKFLPYFIGGALTLGVFITVFLWWKARQRATLPVIDVAGAGFEPVFPEDPAKNA